jgi:hypothetical protein
MDTGQMYCVGLVAGRWAVKLCDVGGEQRECEYKLQIVDYRLERKDWRLEIVDYRF